MMAKKPALKVNEETKVIEGDYEIPGYGKIEVRFNDAVMNYAVITYKALVAFRQLPLPESITSLSGSVSSLVVKGYGRNYYQTKELWLDALVAFIKGDIVQQQNQIYQESLEVAILNSNFKIEAGFVNFKDFPIPVTPDDFNDSEENRIRAEKNLPVLPARTPFNTDEQKIVLKRKLRALDQNFNRWFSQILDRIADAFVVKLTEQLEANNSHLGKTKSGMDSDTPTPSESNDSKRKGRTRKTN